MSTDVTFALTAMLNAQAARSAELEAERTKVAKVAKAPKAPKVKATKVAKPLRGTQGFDASGFAVWRGDRAQGAGYVAGAAGPDHELRKMRTHLASLADLVAREAVECDREANGFDRLSSLAEKAGEREDSLGYAQDAVVSRQMARVKILLSEKILSELESSDNSALIARYRAMGETTEETVVAVSLGTFTGEAYALPEGKFDELRARCRAALAQEG